MAKATKNGAAHKPRFDLNGDEKASGPGVIAITPPNMGLITIPIVGIEPLVFGRFSARAANEAFGEGSKVLAGEKRKKKTVVDPDVQFRDSMYWLEDGRYGVPSSAFRAAMVRAAETAGMEMTKAKTGIFVVADGCDATEPGIMLTAIDPASGEPERLDVCGRDARGDAQPRHRGMFRPGWRMNVQVRFDQDRFTAQGIVNLMNRAGLLVGIGCGRAFSRKSVGCGWGSFQVAADE